MSELVYTCSCEAYQKRIAELEAAQEESYVNAKGIAAFMALNYFSDVPNWSAMNDVRGVLSQISNMVTGLQRKKAAQAQAVPDGWKLVPKKATAEMCVGIMAVTGVGSMTAEHLWLEILRNSPAAPTPKENDKPEVETPPLYYMRDNHTFLPLPESVEIAISAIKKTYMDDGYSHGMLCTKRQGIDQVVHGNGKDKWEQFEVEARAWLSKAISSKGK